MSPQERLEFEKMKATVKALTEVLDVPFIENSKRRIVIPELERLGVLSKNETDGTTGVHKSVNEGGSSSYSVANSYDGTLIVHDQNGNTYKLGYYTV